MAKKKIIPRHPIPWLMWVLAITCLLGLCGWKLYDTFYIKKGYTNRQVQVIALSPLGEVRVYQEDYVNLIDAHPSPLPDVTEWSDDNQGKIDGSEDEIDRLTTFLGSNARTGSYKAQIRSLAALQENAGFLVGKNGGGNNLTGLSLQAKKVESHPTAIAGACKIFLADDDDDEEAEMEEIIVSVADYGDGFVLERLDGDQIIPVREREGYHFLGWERDGELLSIDNITHNAVYFPSFTDDIPPILGIMSGVNDDGDAQLLIMADDRGVGAYGIYAGRENPADIPVDFNLVVAEENGPFPMLMPTTTILIGTGTHYVAAADAACNLQVKEIHVYTITPILDETMTGLDHYYVADVTETELPKPQKTGYYFVGWQEAGADRTGVGEIFQSVLPEKDMELVPVFEPDWYTIELDAGEGSCDPTSVDVCYEAKIGELPIPTRTGYIFEGWFEGVDGTGNEITEDSIMGCEDITLYAKWSPIHYSVVFDINGGASGTMSAMELTYDETYALTRNAYAKPGYVFKGWSLSQDTVSTQNSITARDRSYNGAEWLNEDEVRNLTSEDGATVTLYAIWQEIVPGTMDYRYCLGSYQYFACTTTNYNTENSQNEGAVFVAMSPSGKDPMRFGDNAIWATSLVRTNLNDDAKVDKTGLKTCNTTVNYSYSGLYYNYDPYATSPCTREDVGLSGRLTSSRISSAQTDDYFFVPDMSDFYRYYNGSDWNWFWDMDLDGNADTIPITGVNADGYTGAYYDCVNRASSIWASLGWGGRIWFRNYYTGYSNYPWYISAYGVGVCNPTNGAYASYRNYCQTPLFIRAMYTMPMN